MGKFYIYAYGLSNFLSKFIFLHCPNKDERESLSYILFRMWSQPLREKNGNSFVIENAWLTFISNFLSRPLEYFQLHIGAFNQLQNPQIHLAIPTFSHSFVATAHNSFQFGYNWMPRHILKFWVYVLVTPCITGLLI